MSAAELYVIRIAVMLGVLVGMFLPAGCGPRHDLAPAEQADLAPGSTGAARGEQAGVTILASVGAWRHHPRNIDQIVAPVFVEIENHSGRTLLLRPADLQLIRSDAGSFAPLAPGAITGRLREPAPATLGAGGRPAGSTLTADEGLSSGRSADRQQLGYDAFKFDGRFVALRDAELPSPDMLRYALDTGPLGPAGKRSGFLYFEPFGPSTRYAAFQAELTDAANSRSFGTIRIPFARRE